MLRPKPTLENMQFSLHGHDMDHPSYINLCCGWMKDVSIKRKIHIGTPR